MRSTPEQREARAKRIQEITHAMVRMVTKHENSNKAIADDLNQQGILNLSGKEWKVTDVGNFKVRHLKGSQDATSNPVTATSPEVTPTSSKHSAATSKRKVKATTSDIPVVDHDELPAQEEASAGNANIPVIDVQQEASPDTGTTEPEVLEEPESLETGSNNIVDTTISEADLEIYQAALQVAGQEAEKLSQESPAINSTPTTSPSPLSPEVVAILNDLHESGDLAPLVAWWRETRGKPERTEPVKRPRLRGPEGRVNTGLLIDKTLKDRAIAMAKRDPAATGGSLSLLIELLLWKFLGEPEEFLVSDEE